MSGVDEIVLLGAAGAHAHAGDHLVEHQQDVLVERHLADGLQIAFARQLHAGVPHDWLHDHGGHFMAVLLQAALERVEVVPLDDDHVENAVAHTGGAGNGGAKTLGRQIGQRGVIAIEDGLAPAVIMPLEHHELAAPV